MIQEILHLYHFYPSSSPLLNRLDGLPLRLDHKSQKGADPREQKATAVPFLDHHLHPKEHLSSPEFMLFRMSQPFPPMPRPKVCDSQKVPHTPWLFALFLFLFQLRKERNTTWRYQYSPNSPSTLQSSMQLVRHSLNEKRYANVARCKPNKMPSHI